MAKLVVLAIRDTKIPGFQFPQFAHSVGDGLRRFAAAVNDPQTMICAHPADFEVYQVGEFDSESGELVGAAHPIRLGGGVEYKQKPTQLELPLDGQKVSK